MVTELYRAWPKRIHNHYHGDLTAEEIVKCIEETISVLDQQFVKTDVVGILEHDCTLRNATGILFEAEVINRLAQHPQLDQIMVVDLNQVLTGAFLRRVLQVALSRPTLKVSIFGSMEELNAYLQVKYAH